MVSLHPSREAFWSLMLAKQTCVAHRFSRALQVIDSQHSLNSLTAVQNEFGEGKQLVPAFEIFGYVVAVTCSPVRMQETQKE